MTYHHPFFRHPLFLFLQISPVGKLSVLSLHLFFRLSPCKCLCFQFPLDLSTSFCLIPSLAKVFCCPSSDVIAYFSPRHVQTHKMAHLFLQIFYSRSDLKKIAKFVPGNAGLSQRHGIKIGTLVTIFLFHAIY